MPEYPRIHSNCGGELHYHETVTENRVINKRAVDRYNAKAIIKRITKTLYKCDKCGDLVNIISFPSWKDYVLMGKIRVAPNVYWRLKNEAKGGRRDAQ
jgi:hypothetical protein